MKVVLNVTCGGFSLSQKAKELFATLTNEPYGNLCFCIDIPRHHWALVKVVEELGASAHSDADDACLAKRTDSGPLVVADVPGDKYHIYEYDGMEFLLTPETVEWTSSLDGYADPQKRKRLLEDVLEEVEESADPKRACT